MRPSVFLLCFCELQAIEQPAAFKRGYYFYSSTAGFIMMGQLHLSRIQLN